MRDNKFDWPLDKIIEIRDQLHRKVKGKECTTDMIIKVAWTPVNGQRLLNFYRGKVSRVPRTNEGST